MSVAFVGQDWSDALDSFKVLPLLLAGLFAGLGSGRVVAVC